LRPRDPKHKTQLKWTSFEEKFRHPGVRVSSRNEDEPLYSSFTKDNIFQGPITSKEAKR
jgi:hypothetical protein